MQRSKSVILRTRVPQVVVDALLSMRGKSVSKIVRDIIVSHVAAETTRQLRVDTVAELQRVASAVNYDSADALARDLCLAYERFYIAQRGEGIDCDRAMSNDVVEMFKELGNE